MVDHKRGRELHTRKCNGDLLQPTEEAELDSWYAAMDAEEAGLAPLEVADSGHVEELRSSIRQRLADIRDAVEETRQLDARIEDLRRQNRAPIQQLVSEGILAP